ncbi:hypothetical protein [Methylobacterium sp. Leaf117]|uniref:hypothetical protein n=1 Tax=Methylobacterium sp. Leaf117 TaxID=1736260 RepID=UPI0006F2154D|nr:hypothetical protein [Methylobacterium sp. Leaf117]KQP80657.1 hypothetical protein ASF57_17490 [Methylobacterium sp. Leaf117]
MSALTSRRALIGGLATLPALTAPGIALAAVPSDIVRQCNFAIQQGAWINATAGVEHWPEEKMSLENGRYWEAFEAAYEQPSATLADVQAKARLALRELGDMGKLENGGPAVLLAADVLREVIALCA